MRSTSLLTSPMTSRALALGSTHTPMNTAFWPENRTSWSYSSAPSSTSATSSSLTSEPFCSRMTSRLNSSAERRSVDAATFSWVRPPFVVPAAVR